MPRRQERSRSCAPHRPMRTPVRIPTSNQARSPVDMRGERFVALGLAHARSAWFSELARWSTSAAIPVEFVKCVTIDEVRARLTSGRSFSALLVDAGLPGVDRDLVDDARSRGCAVI